MTFHRAPRTRPRSSILAKRCAALVTGVCIASGTFAATVLPLDMLGGYRGVHIRGVADESWLGLPVSGIGDFNGDGIGDFLVAAERAAGGGTMRGSTYVVFGRTDFPTQLDLATLDGNNGMRIDGDVDFLNEWGASGAGDVNGDGLDDVVIGTPQANHEWRGRGCIVFGRANSPASFSLAQINGFNGFCANGEEDFDNTGQVVAGVGDINGDGYADVGLSSYNHGKLYVIFGKQGPFDASFDLATLDGSNGFLIDDGSDDHSGLGISAQSAGDLDGDGIPELIFGSDSAPGGGTGRGSAWVVYGHDGAWDASLTLAEIGGTKGFRIDGAEDFARLGRGVGSADFDGDGRADLLLGSYNAGGVGDAVVLYGRDTPWPAVVNLATLEANNGRRWVGVSSFDRLGEQALAAGDVNGDGFQDAMFTAPFTDHGGNSSGSAYVAFGSPQRGPLQTSAASLIGRYGFRLDGVEAEGYCGQRHRPLGDIDGDGIDDVALGCNYANAGGQHRGRMVVLFGNAAPLIATPSMSGTTTAEDAIEPSAFTIASLDEAYLDADPLAGAALTTTPAASAIGQWQYRLHHAAAFAPIPAGLSVLDALVLPAQGELRFVPVADFHGTAPTLALRFWDGIGGYTAGTGRDISNDVAALGGFAGDANVLAVGATVLPVNDAPAFAASEPPATPHDAGLVEIAGWATLTSTGPANESAQTLAGFVIDEISEPSLFATLPDIVVEGGSGRLRYASAARASGTSTFRVRARDDGGTANGGQDLSAPQTFAITIVGPPEVFRDGFE